MQNSKPRIRPTTLATILIVVGLLLALGASVPIFLVRFMAESGAGLRFVERLMVATPMAIASALMIGGARYGMRARAGAGDAPGGARQGLFMVGVMAGTIAGLVALLSLLA